MSAAVCKKENAMMRAFDAMEAPTASFCSRTLMWKSTAGMAVLSFIICLMQLLLLAGNGLVVHKR